MSKYKYNFEYGSYFFYYSFIGDLPDDLCINIERLGTAMFYPLQRLKIKSPRL